MCRESTSSLVLQCSECGAYCSSAEEYHKHQKSHRVNRFVCEICHKGFQYDSFLKVHMHSHLSTRPYSCKTCGKSYKWQHHLKTHKCLVPSDTLGALPGSNVSSQTFPNIPHFASPQTSLAAHTLPLQPTTSTVLPSQQNIPQTIWSQTSRGPIQNTGPNIYQE